MVGTLAFMLALNSLGIVLIAQAPHPLWFWAFNGTALASQIVAFVWCCQRATIVRAT
jgi:hypothetical protein